MKSRTLAEGWKEEEGREGVGKERIDKRPAWACGGQVCCEHSSCPLSRPAVDSTDRGQLQLCPSVRLGLGHLLSSGVGFCLPAVIKLSRTVLGSILCLSQSVCRGAALCDQ